MSLIEVIRNIHPIGQGAFYSEIIRKEHDAIHTVVYDCGSYDDGSRMYQTAPQRLIDEINYWSKITKTVDILFISHFHLDHINGVKNLLGVLKVNRLVLPFIDKQERLFYFISNNLDGNNGQNIQMDNFNWYWNW